jgi:putative aldouronate transport system substrate-binding protein
MWPEAKDAIRFLNKLYNEGLLADLILDKDNSLFNQKLISGEAAAFMEGVHYLTAPAYGYLYDKVKQQNPNASFVPALTWKRKASDKDLYVFYPYGDSRYGIGFFVPATTKHPDEVVKYINWLGGEDNFRLPVLGVKDVDYKQTSDGFDMLIKPEDAAKKLAWIPPCYEVLSHPYQSTELVAKSLYGSLPHFDEYRGWLKVVDKNANPDFSIPTVNLPTPALDQYGAIVQRNWDNELPKMIVAPVGQFDSLFDKAVDAYKKDGGDAIASEALANYRQFYGK